MQYGGQMFIWKTKIRECWSRSRACILSSECFLFYFIFWSVFNLATDFFSLFSDYFCCTFCCTCTNVIFTSNAPKVFCGCLQPNTLWCLCQRKQPDLCVCKCIETFLYIQQEESWSDEIRVGFFYFIFCFVFSSWPSERRAVMIQTLWPEISLCSCLQFVWGIYKLVWSLRCPLLVGVGSAWYWWTGDEQKPSPVLFTTIYSELLCLFGKHRLQGWKWMHVQCMIKPVQCCFKFVFCFVFKEWNVESDIFCTSFSESWLFLLLSSSPSPFDIGFKRSTWNVFRYQRFNCVHFWAVLLLRREMTCKTKSVWRQLYVDLHCSIKW